MGWLTLIVILGAAVVGLPRVDGATVRNALEYVGDRRAEAADLSASRSEARIPLEADLARAKTDAAGAPARVEKAAAIPLAPRSATGRLTLLPVRATLPVRGQVMRYVVEVEQGLPNSRVEFADTVRAALNDRRSWAGAGRITFQQVTGGRVDFRIALASPVLTDKVCRRSGLDTEGRVSCFARRNNTAMLNATRWTLGAPAYGRNVALYRVYLINHEVGHRLGHGHLGCPGAGRLAPVMMQQTKGVGACKPNPWPYP